MKFYLDTIAFSEESIFLMCPVAGICSKFLLTPNWHELIDSVVSVRNSSHVIGVCYITTKKSKVESSLIYRSRVSQLRCKADNVFTHDRFLKLRASGVMYK